MVLSHAAIIGASVWEYSVGIICNKYVASVCTCVYSVWLPAGTGSWLASGDAREGRSPRQAPRGAKVAEAQRETVL